ncbi:hypothetical protein UFOVP22_14 [uncultured Caudovirales phage]|uniref:Uncharacterized protein n=1 Tax=uncultured Caudovirales phage TaxID=2100421 RepID=A0A6J5T8F4_9CAUD|nr:hypothetical protein UFOVP22_14 [uncultured Caudovirales phage]
MIIYLEFISGVSLGFECVTKPKGWFLVIDLFIIRVVLDYEAV